MHKELLHLNYTKTNMVTLHKKERYHTGKRSKRIWLKKENALNVSIVKGIGVRTGAGTALERELM